jgi:hypothetical protein
MLDVGPFSVDVNCEIEEIRHEHRGRLPLRLEHVQPSTMTMSGWRTAYSPGTMSREMGVDGASRGALTSHPRGM